MLFAGLFFRHRFFILESYHDGVWTRNYCNNWEVQYCMAKHKKGVIADSLELHEDGRDSSYLS